MPSPGTSSPPFRGAFLNASFCRRLSSSSFFLLLRNEACAAFDWTDGFARTGSILDLPADCVGFWTPFSMVLPREDLFRSSTDRLAFKISSSNFFEPPCSSSDRSIGVGVPSTFDFHLSKSIVPALSLVFGISAMRRSLEEDLDSSRERNSVSRTTGLLVFASSARSSSAVSCLESCVLVF